MESEKIIKWLKEHPHFKVNKMCSDIKIDTSNFSKQLSSGIILEKNIQPIIKIISNYGYK